MDCYEGNELYLRFIQPLRRITTRLPHFALVGLIELLYGSLCIYRLLGKLLPLPLRRYIETVWWPMTPKKRRLVIYDQLNPSYAKYHKKNEAIELLPGISLVVGNPIDQMMHRSGPLNAMCKKLNRFGQRWTWGGFISWGNRGEPGWAWSMR